MSPAPARTVPPPIPGLDGLRALSVLIVMLSHSGLENVVPGVFGVTVFFFVSGFLITTLLVREKRETGRIALRSFYIRRMLRLYPPLLAFIAVCCVAALARGEAVNLLGLGGGLFYFANYLAIFDMQALSAFGGHLWSLAVEEHFYFFFPLLLVWLLPRPRLILPVLLGLCLAALAGRTAVTLLFPRIATDYAGMASEMRMDSVLAGAIVALVWNRPAGPDFVRRVTWWPWVAAGLVALLASFVVRDAFFRSTLRYSLQELALVPLVLAATVSPRFPLAVRLMNCSLLVWLGRRSYALYLWHIAIFEAGLRLKPADWSFAAVMLVGWIAAFALAALSYRLVEQPIFALRRRFGSHVSDAEPAPAPRPAAARLEKPL